ncbi:MAG: hypothetical protein ABIW76_07280 [Fibrobacteria bacterium]
MEKKFEKQAEKNVKKEREKVAGNGTEKGRRIPDKLENRHP